MIARERILSVRGVQLFERQIGEGPPVVVLHGGAGAHHDYLLPGFDALASGGSPEANRTLIYYDQRGGGQSPAPRDLPVGWREHVADLEALREIWGIDRLTIAGYSWGALLAMLYATEHPQRVARLALVSPAPAWFVARAEFERRFQERNLAPELQAERQRLRDSGLRERDPVGYQRRLFELSVTAYFHNPSRVRDLTPFRITGRTQQEVWASLGEYDLRPALRHLSIPAIVLHGESDPVPIESARETARLLNAEFHAIPACGHVPYVEAFDVFVRVIGGFLR